MSRRRYLSLAVALLAVTALVAGTGGFSTTATDRGVSVEVAEDPNAFLGLEQTQRSGENLTATVNAAQTDNGTETLSDGGNETTATNATGNTTRNETTNATRGDENETAYVDVTVINQFPAGTRLATVEVTAQGKSVELGPLAPGERATQTFSSVSCGDSIGIKASGDGVAVRLTRTVSCS
ncbi:hypothetical protein [Halorubrum sp. Eb13]|uniref:hypothetical protein n=1 Tax=Halorubrum sp. Eb13 TaxID=1383843 RepID=UPI000B989794|nr:hypothetical protein [Halorubrum sp. Eb13]OYR45771.1 hypothetical protein DJ75_07125 [Halorubrum sp. Eb13]